LSGDQEAFANYNARDGKNAVYAYRSNVKDNVDNEKNVMKKVIK